MGFGSAVVSLLDARVDLKQSKIRTFITGLDAAMGGGIVMTGGEIRHSF